MKNVLKLGKALNKVEQKQIVGGLLKGQCNTDSDCCIYPHTISYGYLCNGATPSGPGICVPGIFFENPCGL
ncbi:hypothetical protein [Winogradskyella sp.]|uniref:hypothetical protein n=1 Tax=Winogradskyella sp. TaxID=1883156 RepID=UPI003231F5E2